MVDATYVMHITLDTDHWHHSHRDDVDPAVVTIVGQQIAEMLALGSVEIRPGYALMGAVSGAAMVATVESATGPLVTIAVARTSKVSPRLWTEIGGVGPHPSAPWCAARLYPALSADLDAATWLADFERCAAWAWIERARRGAAA